MSQSLLDPIVSDPELEDDDPIFSHIVARDDNRSADAIITEARVMGTPITALCGHVWVPSRNPENHPICTKCIDVLKNGHGPNKN